MPTGEAVVFPSMVFPLVVRDEQTASLIGDVAYGDRMLALFTLRDPEAEATPDNLFET